MRAWLRARLGRQHREPVVWTRTDFARILSEAEEAARAGRDLDRLMAARRESTW